MNALVPYFAPEILFYSLSANVPAGFGAGETIHVDDAMTFRQLNTVPHWRRVLSNFYALSRVDSALFELDGRNWRSVEHYFHARKFLDILPEYYEEFSLNSGSDLSKATGAAVKRAGRARKMSPAMREQWDATGSREVMQRALRAKYTQNDYCRQILLLTYPAVLKHRPGRFADIVIERDLMALRDELRAEATAEVAINVGAIEPVAN